MENEKAVILKQLYDLQELIENVQHPINHTRKVSNLHNYAERMKPYLNDFERARFYSLLKHALQIVDYSLLEAYSYVSEAILQIESHE